MSDSSLLVVAILLGAAGGVVFAGVFRWWKNKPVGGEAGKFPPIAAYDSVVLRVEQGADGLMTALVFLGRETLKGWKSYRGWIRRWQVDGGPKWQLHLANLSEGIATALDSGVIIAATAEPLGVTAVDPVTGAHVWQVPHRERIRVRDPVRFGDSILWLFEDGIIKRINATDGVVTEERQLRGEHEFGPLTNGGTRLFLPLEHDRIFIGGTVNDDGRLEGGVRVDFKSMESGPPALFVQACDGERVERDRWMQRTPPPPGRYPIEDDWIIWKPELSIFDDQLVVLVRKNEWGDEPPIGVGFVDPATMKLGRVVKLDKKVKRTDRRHLYRAGDSLVVSLWYVWQERAPGSEDGVVSTVAYIIDPARYTLLAALSDDGKPSTVYRPDRSVAWSGVL